MIIKESRLHVTCNSGAKVALCIGFSSDHKKSYMSSGDVIAVTVKKATPNSKVTSGTIYYAVIVRTKKEKNGLAFSDNAIVLLDKNYEMVGTRVFGPVDKKIKSKFPKVASLSEETLGLF